MGTIAKERLEDFNAVLRDAVKRIRQAADPDKIVLFGSRARGNARPDSDYDLLIIKHSNLPRYRRCGPIYAALAGIPAEMEIIVYTPEEINDWSNVPKAFVTAALSEGKVLYEKAG